MEKQSELKYIEEKKINKLRDQKFKEELGDNYEESEISEEKISNSNSDIIVEEKEESSVKEDKILEDENDKLPPFWKLGDNPFNPLEYMSNILKDECLKNQIFKKDKIELEENKKEVQFDIESN